jgi:hypothetical protein
MVVPLRGLAEGSPLDLRGPSPHTEADRVILRPGQARSLHRAGSADLFGLFDLAQRETGSTVREEHVRVAILAGGGLVPAHMGDHRNQSFRAAILICQPRAGEGEQTSPGQCDFAIPSAPGRQPGRGVWSRSGRGCEQAESPGVGNGRGSGVCAELDSARIR